MPPVLPEHPSIITRDRARAPGKGDGNQILKEENTEAGAEAKSVLMREETELKTLQTQIAKL